MLKISASIVIYNEDKNTLKNVIDSFLAINLDKELIIVDNSPTNDLKEFVEDFNEVTYIHSPKNIGFGTAHNLAFKKLQNKSNLHLILNPDIYFDAQEITQMILWMSQSADISLATPKVYYPDGKLQPTIRNIPTPMTLFKRRANIFGIFDNFIKQDQLEDVKFDTVSSIPFAHGCFLLFTTKTFSSLNGFDERFFLYMEDIDIFIRAKKFGKTVINPNYKIYHEYRKSSSTNLKPLLWHMCSSIKFFAKHGYIYHR